MKQISSMFAVIFVACFQPWKAEALLPGVDPSVTDFIDTLPNKYAYLTVTSQTTPLIKVQYTKPPTTPDATVQDELNELKVMYNQVVSTDINEPRVVVYRRSAGAGVVILGWKVELFQQTKGDVKSSLENEFPGVEFIEVKKFLDNFKSAFSCPKEAQKEKIEIA